MKETAKRFVAYLEALKGQKAWTRARAALRRSLAFDPGAYPPAMPYVEPFVREEGWRREAHYLVAALYALKDGDHQEGRTLARALRGKAQDSASIERRFLALLDADRDQITHRLRQAVGLVEGGLDFALLLNDLIYWFYPEKTVQARWAREFFGTPSEGSGTEATEVTK
ncbi:type I-E CRISPR-associated protein Cse2/CasB [Marinithermus hydrothermalis]|uniref:CRISPR-associated protein, Cse2 family n=1 Tax=Marinithermus hydrothermalis (strain DSM 14884 / JCM 11576 / T1) TaxID=869210 RepID=F2NLA3_MARHT|nr:type I-E CRISPR-associated protein Cse2/CasB [Marinithermus hydrothermalis]AEB11722.1 CRISPR-associated protein, Cse2 family [Marinithermus hydrothermalis DSM 14884]